MVTGWNEWTAGRFSRPGRPVVFVDQFNEEYSRDIEPVGGLHNDNYYYQLVSNIRRYKGAARNSQSFVPENDQRRRCVRSMEGCRPGIRRPRIRYRSSGLRSRRGALRERHRPQRHCGVKVARDATNFYFYAQTREAITPRSDPGWMLLLIDADSNSKTGWEGYDFIVNRTMDGKQTWVEQNTGGWNWKKISPVQLKVDGNELMLAIPRAASGTLAGETKSRWISSGGTTHRNRAISWIPT